MGTAVEACLSDFPFWFFTEEGDPGFMDSCNSLCIQRFRCGVSSAKKREAAENWLFVGFPGGGFGLRPTKFTSIRRRALEGVCAMPYFVSYTGAPGCLSEDFSADNFAFEGADRHIPIA